LTSENNFEKVEFTGPEMVCKPRDRDNSIFVSCGQDSYIIPADKIDINVIFFHYNFLKDLKDLQTVKSLENSFFFKTVIQFADLFEVKLEKFDHICDSLAQKTIGQGVLSSISPFVNGLKNLFGSFFEGMIKVITSFSLKIGVLFWG
jgi:hypothetical protein